MTVKATAPFQPGFALQDGSALNAALGYSSETGIVALGTTQATAYALRAGINVVGTAAAATGVRLPAPTPGSAETVVFNDGASTLTIYASGTDTIDGVAGATGVSLTAAARCAFYPTDVGKWKSALLGATSA